MRDLMIWGVALAFLLAAFHTVHIRREVYALGQTIGALENAVEEQRRVGDNLQLELERLVSPAELAARAERTGVAISAPEAGQR